MSPPFLEDGTSAGTYLAVLPGLILFGTGLAFVLTVNDPVGLDSLPDSEDGEASGVSATAEQAGGAFDIAALYALFHSVYLSRLRYLIDTGPLHRLTPKQNAQLREALQAAE